MSRGLARRGGGKPFSKQQVVRILSNPIYVGVVRWGEAVTENAHEAIVPPAKFRRVQLKLAKTTRHRRNHRYSRGRCYLLRGLVRCSCGAMMIPKGTAGNGGTYHYYVCTRQSHLGVKIDCQAPAVPAEALERALIDRLVRLGLRTSERERIAHEARLSIDQSARQQEAEAEAIRHRLSTVQTEIGNLIGVLKQVGKSAIASVRDELSALESERDRLREQLAETASAAAPLLSVNRAAANFVRNWSSIDKILSQASAEDLQAILPHFVQVVRLSFEDDGRSGSYRLQLFPEVGPLDGRLETQHGADPGDSETAPVLTESAMVCESGEKTPPSRGGYD